MNICGWFGHAFMICTCIAMVCLAAMALAMTIHVVKDTWR